MTVFVPTFRFETYLARHFRVLVGANEDDAIGSGDAALAGDIFTLRRTAVPHSLLVTDDGRMAARVAQGSTVGASGDTSRIVDFHTLMGPRGEVVDLLLLTIGNGQCGGVDHILPLAPIVMGREYELICSGREPMPGRFSEVNTARQQAQARYAPHRPQGLYGNIAV